MLEDDNEKNQVKACFVNKTNRKILLIWKKKYGEKKYYITIGPGISTKLVTYVGHEWTAVDKINGQNKCFREELLSFNVNL